MQTCRKILEGFHFPMAFTGEEMASLCEQAAGLESVQAGEVLIREGDIDRDLWLLLEGRFHVIKRVRPDLPLGVLQAGSFCGEIAWFTGQSRTASVVAAEAGRALRFRFDALDTLEPDLLFKIYHNLLADLMGRLRTMNQLLFRLAQLERGHFGSAMSTSPIGYIPGTRLMEQLTPEEQRVLRELQPGAEKVRAGEFLFRAGRRYDTFFLLFKGCVVATLNEDPGLMLIHLGPDRVLGMDAFFRDGVQGANLIAAENCEGLRISLHDFETLDRRFRLKFYWQMAENLINRLQPLNIVQIKLEHMEGRMWFGG